MDGSKVHRQRYLGSIRVVASFPCPWNGICGVGNRLLDPDTCALRSNNPLVKLVICGHPKRKGRASVLRRDRERCCRTLNRLGLWGENRATEGQSKSAVADSDVPALLSVVREGGMAGLQCCRRRIRMWNVRMKWWIDDGRTVVKCWSCDGGARAYTRPGGSVIAFRMEGFEA